jgi:septum formation protein
MPAPRLILASRSPRRAKLLRDAGFAFERVDPPFDDPSTPGTPDEAGAASPPALAMQLAGMKATSVVTGAQIDRDDHALILASDTIVVGPGGALLGQPGDADEARAMLRSLVDATHEVATGVALLASISFDHATFADVVRVALGGVPADVLDAYIDSGAWRGKAGGYNLAELENDWPFTVTGDPATVVGLPMRKLVLALQSFGVVPTEPAAAHEPGADRR